MKIAQERKEKKMKIATSQQTKASTKQFRMEENKIQ
jgi:hypothetical protein